MTFTAKARSLFEWYRALRALNRILATMGVAVLCLAGCGQNGETPAGPPLSAGATLQMENLTDHSIWYVKVGDCGTAGRGTDLLRADVMPIGDRRTFTLAPGCKQVRVETDPALLGRMAWDSIDLAPGGVDTLRLTEWSYAG